MASALLCVAGLYREANGIKGSGLCICQCEISIEAIWPSSWPHALEEYVMRKRLSCEPGLLLLLITVLDANRKQYFQNQIEQALKRQVDYIHVGRPGRIGSMG